MIVVLGIAIIVPWFLNRTAPTENTLVLYCSHDSVFTDAIIRQFEAKSGIAVQVRYDEETNKSLGLTTLMITGRTQPRCDVFWNNQTLGTIRLKEEGLPAAVDPALFARIMIYFNDT